MSEQSRPAGGGSAPGGGSGAAEGPAPAAGRGGQEPVQDGQEPVQDGRTPASQWAPAPPPAGGGPAGPGWFAPPAPAAAEVPASGTGAAAPAGWKRWLAIGVPVLVVLGVLAGIGLSLRGGGSPAASGAQAASAQPSAGPDGVIAADVSPFDFKAGDCFTDFQAATRSATVVTCSTPHAAQIIATFAYQPSDTFPGKDALNVKAEQVCSSVKLNEHADKYPTLRTSYGMPSEGTWQEGDRRIDCFVIVDGGNKLKDSLIG